MYLGRFFITAILGLVWYFSDYWQTATQYLLCFLCCLSAPVLFRKIGRETSTQTDEDVKEGTLKENGGEPQLVCPDAFDGVSNTEATTQVGILKEPQYPHLQRGLLQVFECLYNQLLLSWYHVPEPRENQPLHQVLCREFSLVTDRVIKKAKVVDVCEAVVGCIRILTLHLHNAKQPDREPLFGSRAEEMAVLRVFSEALVRNLFPETLCGLDVNRCALNEIVALKGLELLVIWLCDPDNLNQLVVRQLDSVTPKSSVEELCGSDSEAASLTSLDSENEACGLASQSCGGDEISVCSRIKSKKKANKLKLGWSKFVDKMKSKKAKKKKMKKVEQDLMIRAMTALDDMANESENNSREGSIRSPHNSDSENSDIENYLTSVQEDMMEFKLSYEMWRVGNWTVTIPYVNWENKQLILTVHLEERDNPENLQWDIKKTHLDVIHFRNRWQDSTSLPLISVLEESFETIGDEIIQHARVSVEQFLQALVSDDLIGHTQPVFQFLCPLDKLLSEEEHYGGVWGLLSGLAYFLTPGQEEEEVNGPLTEPKMEDSVSPYRETMRPTAATLEAQSEKSRELTNSALPSIIISASGALVEPFEDEAEKEPKTLFRSDLPCNEACFQDKMDELDNPLTSQLKLIIKGLSRSRSQESLSSTKATSIESDCMQTDSDCNQMSCRNRSFGENSDGPSGKHSGGRSTKREKLCFRLSGGLHKMKSKDQGSLPKEDESLCQKTQASWEQLEATKAIIDLLKEISGLFRLFKFRVHIIEKELNKSVRRWFICLFSQSKLFFFIGNSILLNIFDAILKPFMPILKKKVNSFLNKVHPTEEQIASYIDNLREKQWPEGLPSAPNPPRTSEEKCETRERAHYLITSRYSNYLILKKTDVETVFKLFQDSEENKKLVYMLLSFLLREFLPSEDALNVSAVALQKVNGDSS